MGERLSRIIYALKFAFYLVIFLVLWGVIALIGTAEYARW